MHSLVGESPQDGRRGVEQVTLFGREGGEPRREPGVALASGLLHEATAGIRDVDDDLAPVVDSLVRGLLEQRAAARAAKDFAAADAIRDQIKAAGVEIEDTPSGPKWSVG